MGRNLLGHRELKTAGTIDWQAGHRQILEAKEKEAKNLALLEGTGINPAHLSDNLKGDTNKEPFL